MYKKYFQSNEEYEITSLNIKSPLIIDLNKMGSWHSAEFLSHAYAGYKMLKSKHLSSSQNFDLLLGIK